MGSKTWTASAPGKIILMGEHAVVYGRPALAVPVQQVQATATLHVDEQAGELWIDARDLAQRYALSGAPADDTLAVCVRGTLAALHAVPPAGELLIQSTIPMAGGLGSGAAVSTAIVRALAAWSGRTLTPADVSALVFDVERLYHGTPSGIDNTVIAYEQPVWFVKGQAPAPFAVPHPFWIVIADSGIACPTRETVGDVRRGWLDEPARYEMLFGQIGDVVIAARDALLGGDWPALGRHLQANHALLRQLDVSSAALDRLMAAAMAAGALGAKLSGGGRGGNVIALVDPGRADSVQEALRAAGAAGLILTQVA